MTKLEKLADENNFKAVLNVSADPDGSRVYEKTHYLTDRI